MALVTVRVSSFVMEIECKAENEDEFWEGSSLKEEVAEEILNHVTLITATYDEPEKEEEDEEC